MITVGFSSKASVDIDIFSFFKINENFVVSSYIDIPMINPSVAQYELHVNPLLKPVK